MVEKVKVTPYVERVAASDNLRFALDGSGASPTERPFGPATAGAETVPEPEAPSGSDGSKASPN